MEAVILSTWLDTNGQNARFVRAAERHAFAIGKTDPAGVVARYAEAAAKGDSLRIRSANRGRNYLDFPVDILWNRDTDQQVRRLAHQADVIHLNNSYRAYKQLHLRKPALLHHHGSLFRSDPGHMLQAARYYRFEQAVSTIDLTRYAPDVLHWLPTAYDLDELAKERKPNKSKKVRIVHAPTNRENKATAALIAATEGMAGVELVLVEGKTNAQCIAIKATADIVFDQLAYGYGCNAVEAWAMSIPVIAGADDWTLNAMETRFGSLPFYLANEYDLRARLTELVEDRALREEYGQRGRAHAERYHAEQPALEVLAGLYDAAIRRYQARPDMAATSATTFQNSQGRIVRVDGQRLVWSSTGMLTTSDPFVIERLRYFTTQRPGFGITEL